MSEHQEAVALMEWARMSRAGIPELDLLYHIPNGGHRHPAVASKLQAEGVKPGVPDYFLPVPRGNYHGLYVELKTEKGRATKNQKFWCVQLKQQGYQAVIANGWETAAHCIRTYLEGRE